jgi:hypothetical protein
MSAGFSRYDVYYNFNSYHPIQRLETRCTSLLVYGLTDYYYYVSHNVSSVRL